MENTISDSTITTQRQVRESDSIHSCDIPFCHTASRFLLQDILNEIVFIPWYRIRLANFFGKLMLERAYLTRFI